MENMILEFKGISKNFSGVEVLRDINFSVKQGSCHCIIGENGAGKSTLIKILMGVIPRSSGTILYEGKPLEIHSTREAFHHGITAVFQELNMVDSLTVEENITLGKEQSKFGIIKKDEFNPSYEILKEVDSTLRLDQAVGMLSFAQKQMIEIAKAVGSNAKVIILDEPTAALSEDEVGKLFSMIKRLKEKGVSIIYISHRLNELFDVGDVITVLRDGQLIGTKQVDEIGTRDELIKMMLGKVIVEGYIPNHVNKNVCALELEGLRNQKLKDVSFKLYQGEVLGVYGLVGAGKSEVARAIFGADKSTGVMRIMGVENKPGSARASIREGIALIPEERRLQGLCTMLTINDNIPMMNFKPVLRNKLYSPRKAKALAESFIKKLSIACWGNAQEVVRLSGGNQQKVVFSKCINAEPRILLLDEPTRGVDVGAKQEIYAIIRELSQQGNSVVVFSSELTEVINLCDRIVLMNGGEIKAILENDSGLDTEYIMNVVTGGEKTNG